MSIRVPYQGRKKRSICPWPQQRGCAPSVPGGTWVLFLIENPALKTLGYFQQKKKDAKHVLCLGTHSPRRVRPAGGPGRETLFRRCDGKRSWKARPRPAGYVTDEPSSRSTALRLFRCFRKCVFHRINVNRGLIVTDPGNLVRGYDYFSAGVPMAAFDDDFANHPCPSVDQ